MADVYLSEEENWDEISSFSPRCSFSTSTSRSSPDIVLPETRRHSFKLVTFILICIILGISAQTKEKLQEVKVEEQTQAVEDESYVFIV